MAIVYQKLKSIKRQWAALTLQNSLHRWWEKKIIYLYSEMNAVENFATGIITTQALGAGSSCDHRGWQSGPSWNCDYDQLGSQGFGYSFSFYHRNGFDWAGRTSSRRSRGLCQKGYALNDRVGTSYLERNTKTSFKGKRSEKKFSWIKMAIWIKW